MKRIILFFTFLFLCYSLILSAQMSVYFINVGQGDAEYIELPNGKNVIIDGGKDYSTSRSNPVIAFLENKGVTTINYVVATHPDADHINGLQAILKKYRVEKVYDPMCRKSGAGNKKGDSARMV